MLFNITAAPAGSNCTLNLNGAAYSMTNCAGQYNLTPGTYDYNVTISTNSAVQTILSQSITVAGVQAVTNTTAPPSYSSRAPLSGATLTGNTAEVSINVTSPATSCTLTVNNVIYVTTLTNNQTPLCTYNLQNLTAGVYTYSAIVNLSNGSNTTLEQRTFTILPPIVPAVTTTILPPNTAPTPPATTPTATDNTTTAPKTTAPPQAPQPSPYLLETYNTAVAKETPLQKTDDVQGSTLCTTTLPITGYLLFGILIILTITLLILYKLSSTPLWITITLLSLSSLVIIQLVSTTLSCTTTFTLPNTLSLIVAILGTFTVVMMNVIGGKVANT